ncbi:MAG: GTP-binding protein [Clostridia bacterium]|nr:GTP-binding protein [Clostridia bacterium]
MIEIDVFSGFLGAGKTTLIKKLIKEAYSGEKIVLIENEFGEIGIDGGFMKEAGIEITEMNSGCICCSLVGDFGEALNRVINDLAPERILIEPSGVGKLSDVIGAITRLDNENAKVGSAVTVVDAGKFRVYSKNFGEFFLNQIEHAATVILSHTDKVSEERLAECVAKIREINPDATIVTTPWDKITGKQILDAIRQSNSLESQLKELEEQARKDAHHHHHHHHHDGEECCCHHDDDDDDDDDDEDEHEHHHHHHHDGEECCCHHDDNDDDDDDDEDEHEHEHHHHHHHHHGHDADEIFTSWGLETTRRYTIDEITDKLESLMDEGTYGTILRAKGIVPASDGSWIHFDYVPGEPDVRTGTAEVTGRLCVIGSSINEKALAELFA